MCWLNESIRTQFTPTYLFSITRRALLRYLFGFSLVDDVSFLPAELLEMKIGSSVLPSLNRGVAGAMLYAAANLLSWRAGKQVLGQVVWRAQGRTLLFSGLPFGVAFH